MVNTFDDEINSDGDCSLREAVQAANSDNPYDACTSGSGDDTISLPPGTYTLSIIGGGEDNNQQGDLDISGVLTITGTSAATTILQAGTDTFNGFDRHTCHLSRKRNAYSESRWLLCVPG
jgi:CSLREA domain-containing protein